MGFLSGVTYAWSEVTLSVNKLITLKRSLASSDSKPVPACSVNTLHCPSRSCKMLELKQVRHADLPSWR